MRAASIPSDDDDIVFLCRFAMSKQQLYNLFIVLHASEQWPCDIAKSEPVHVVSQGQTTTTSFFIVICERSDDKEYFLHVVLQEATGTSVFFTSLQKAKMR